MTKHIITSSQKRKFYKGSGAALPLQKVYETYGEFRQWCKTNKIHRRLGYSTMKEAWDSNPKYFVHIPGNNTLIHVVG